MTKTAHTPGPWVRIDRANYAEIVQFDGSSGPVIAIVAKAADADLIAAAPEAIEALRRIQSLAAKCEHLPDTDGLRRAYRDIDAAAQIALAKLDGRS